MNFISKKKLKVTPYCPHVLAAPYTIRLVKGTHAQAYGFIVRRIRVNNLSIHPERMKVPMCTVIIIWNDKDSNHDHYDLLQEMVRANQSSPFLYSIKGE